ncbi:MAG TPA: hypothetical protein VF817_00855 [Patescibacteria group bacterium]
MTYTGAEYSIEQLFDELKKQVRTENVRDFEAYRDLVDNLIEEKKSYGFFADEEDLVQLKRDLEARWLEIDRSLHA